MDTYRASEGYSLSGECREWEKSGHGTNRANERHSQAGEHRGGTSKDTETNQISKRLSRTGGCRRREKSGHGEQPSKQGTLTSCRAQREGQVRTWKQTMQARGTH